MKRLIASLLLVMSAATPAAAQVTPVPHTFTPNTVIRSSEVNANFTEIFSKALNRTGGAMTGTLQVQAITLAAHNTYDLGTASVRFKDGFFAGVLNAGTLVLSGGITAGSGSVGIVDASGKIPAISATYFASLSGADLTGIVETAIVDGAILARVASTETISATWTFSGAPLLNNNVGINTKNSTGTVVNIAHINGANNYLFGSANVLDVNNTTLAAGSAIDFQTNSASRANIDSTGSFNFLGAIAMSGTITPSTLAAGNNNDYNPTGLSGAYLIRLTGDGGGTSALTGLAGGVAGRKVVLCNIGTNDIAVADESASSTAAMRFADTTGLTLDSGLSGPSCVEFLYDNTSSRWRPLGFQP